MSQARIGDVDLRADDAVFADNGFTREHREGAQRGIRANADARFDERACRIFDGDACQHQVAQNPLAHFNGNLGQLQPGIDTKHDIRVGRHDGGHPLARIAQQRDHVGQIKLTLYIVGAQIAQRGKKRRRGEGVHRGVDLPDCLLLMRGVPRLNNTDDIAIHIAQHAAIGTGVAGKHGRQQCRRCMGFTMVCDKFTQDIGGKKRRIAGYDQDGAGVLGKNRSGHQCGMAGAALLGLRRVLDGTRAEKRIYRTAHRLSLVTYHNYTPRHARLGQRIENMGKQRAATDRMQRLGRLRLHPGRFSRRKHHGSDR